MWLDAGMHRPRTLIALSVAALGLTAACSSAGEQVADKVNDEAAKRLEISTDDISTTCPDDADAEKGEKFECIVDIEGQDLPALIEFTSDDEFTFEFAGEAFEKEEFTSTLSEELGSEEWLGTEVTELECPGETFVVIAADETIECQGTDASGSEGSAVIGLDAEGTAYIVELTN